MTHPRLVAAGAALIACALCFAWGRLGAKPPPVATASTAVAAQAAQEQHHEAAQLAAAMGDHLAAHIKKKTTFRKAVPQSAPVPPGCPACLCDVTTVEEEADVAKDSQSNLLAANTSGGSKATIASQTTATRSEPLPAPRLGLGAVAGLTFKGEAEYGGRLDYKWLSATVTNRGVLLGATWRFQ